MNHSTRDGERGQVLAIFAAALIALLVAVGVVIDGGNAMSQQRDAQNGADAASEAGTTVIAQYLMGGSSATGATGTCPTAPADSWDLEVCKAVYGSAATNGLTITTATYTDWKGDLLTQVGAGAMPTGAQGVRVEGSRTFGTYFARVIGQNSITTSTGATAVTGVITSLCLPGTGCGLFPLTVPYVTSNCDNNGTLVPGEGDWPFLGDADTTVANEAIIPICKDKNNDLGGGSAGSVGWLDLSTAIGATISGTCAKNFVDAITTPCISSMAFPTWVQTFTGGVGKGGPTIQSTLNTFHDSTVQIPLFDGTCKVKPSGTGLGDCPSGQIGVGVNTWYHIPSFGSFKVDYFYLDGNDRKECDNAPGQPYVSGNGSNGCVKGWWVIALPGPGSVGLGSVSPSTTNKLGVQLIR
jgi:Flp pilus assembly protein TadG